MLYLAFGVGAVTLGSSSLACLLRLRSVTGFVLAAYAIGWAEVVAVCFSLSAGSWLERWTLLAAFLVVNTAAVGAWLVAGRPAPPAIGEALGRARGAAGDPLVAILLAVSALALTYTFVVSVTTAPNDGDPLVYELTRAAFWRQEHGIEHLGAAYDARIDYSPPVAETGVLAVMTLSGSDRFVGLPQWVALVMLALATYGVGRRIGLERRAALFGAALVPTLPVALVQSWSAFTDLVFSSFAVTAVYFGLGALGLELLPFALAVGLGMGTKFLGPIFAPLLAAILLVAQPARRWLPLGLAAIAGAGLASTWYLHTQYTAGDPVGNGGGGTQTYGFAPIVTTFQHLTVELFDLSGASGKGVWLYSAAALAVGAVAAARGTPSLFSAAAAIAATPPLVSLLARAWADTGVWLGDDVLGRAELVDLLHDRSASTLSDGAVSWFGPVGALLALGVPAFVAVEVRRRRLPRVALVLTAIPLAAIGAIALVISYQPYQGRYFVSAMALGAAVVGAVATSRRWLGVAVVGVASVTAALSLANSLGKPSGLAGPSVWSLSRWEQQGLLRPTAGGQDEAFTMQFVEDHVPEDSRVAIALVSNSFAAPYFGRNLGRRLTILDRGDVIRDGVDWIVAAPGRRLIGCPEVWDRDRLGLFGWAVWERSGPDTCMLPSLLESG